MTDNKPSDRGQSKAEHPTNEDDAPKLGGVRSDLHTMLLPMFPDKPETTCFESEIDGCTITMQASDEGGRIATAVDRKLLNLISAHVRDMICAGGEPTRHIIVDVREVLDLVAGEGIGGADYTRVTARLQRLHATKIVAERSIGPGLSRRREFNWIDAFEQDIRQTAGGKKIVRLKISLSEDAFRWITTNEGFDMSRDRFQAITSSRTSSWRIFEICLATLAKARGLDVYIQIDELRRRVPITDHLRGFKSRALKQAITAITESEEMSRYLAVQLVRSTDDGYEILPSGKRAPLDSVYVHVRRGPDPLPNLTTLLPEAAPANSVVPPTAVGALADMLSGIPEDQLPLFESEDQM